jgi:ATP-binding cassette subfamily F protein 3
LFALLSQNSAAWQKDTHLENSNILILDEPTNHLDSDTRESLEKALHIYPGAILIISHDRYFMNKIANKLWIIEE